jgi:hypothetical protein
VFNHQEHPGQRIDEETIESIHTAIGDKVGSKFFIIAPRNVFDFQQDYIDLGQVRYYAMRIPYSIINELHRKEFTALKQPNDETAVNDTVDSVGFDFIRPPRVDWKVGVGTRQGQMLNEAYVQITGFRSSVRLRGEDLYGGLETLSMVMLDHQYNGDIFNLSAVFYNQQLESAGWCAWFPLEELGEQIMVVFIDTHGNELRVVIPRTQFLSEPAVQPIAAELNAGV